MSILYDPIIYGKNSTERIVGIEVDNNSAELFILEDDGSIRSEFTENRFWLLCNENPGGFVRLDGDLYYKYGKQFSNREEFNKTKYFLKKNYDIYSIHDPKESLMVLRGYTYFKGLKPTDIPILSFDIETTSLDHGPSAKLLLITNTFRKNNKITRKLFAYSDYKSEAEMIDDWCAWVRQVDPTIICGHNIFMYDLPYLQFIARRAGTDLFLGRNNSALSINSTYKSRFRIDGSRDMEYGKCEIHGRELIDTLFLAYRYDIASKKYESYGLKPIIKIEGLEDKNRQFYDASLIRKNYLIPDEWKKIKVYAEFDADDALKLFDLMIPASFYWTQMIPKSLQQVHESATGSQINSLLVRSYLQEKHSIPKASSGEKFEGAISWGQAGVYSNVFKLDVASLYPSIILTYNIYDKEKDPKGNFLKMMQLLTKERLKNKKLAKDTNNNYYKDLEQSQKIGINSGYGFMAAVGLNFNSPSNAALVTRYGREILQKAIVWATGKELELNNE